MVGKELGFCAVTLPGLGRISSVNVIQNSIYVSMAGLRVLVMALKNEIIFDLIVFYNHLNYQPEQNVHKQQASYSNKSFSVVVNAVFHYATPTPSKHCSIFSQVRRVHQQQGGHIYNYLLSKASCPVYRHWGISSF